MDEAQHAPDLETRLLSSLHSTHPVEGLTHNFYRYPARMSPQFARAVVRDLTEPGDIVLDPFMGGGTTVVESVAAGRNAIGLDLNPLATFLATVKTTPLSVRDERAVESWARSVTSDWDTDSHPSSDQAEPDPRTKNLPRSLIPSFELALERATALPFPRQQRFARCVLLRLGQWAIDCKNVMPDLGAMSRMVLSFTQEMLACLDDLAAEAREHGVQKRKITAHRQILLRSSVGLEQDARLRDIERRPRLVLTSPPYPAVHVLYHRWQVQGRRETPAPYWFIGAYDGHGASHYTMGSRSAYGLDTYFRTLVASYRSVRKMIAPDALVVQLVAFSDSDSQLPAFLAAMEEAGFREAAPITASRAELWRTVPNRKWYCRIDTTCGSALELLLFHRPV